MPGGDPFKAQFLLQVRAEGEGEVDRLNQALAQARARAAEVRQEFISGVTDAAAYKKGLAEATGQVGFLQKRLEEIVVSMDGLSAQAAKTAAAVEAAAQKEADAFSALATKHEAMLAKEATAAEAAAQKEAEAFAALATKHQAMMDRMAADAEAAALKEAQEFANLATKHEQYLTREVEAAERAALEEAEAYAATATKHEQYLAREAEAAETAAMKEAEVLIKAAADHVAFLAKADAQEAKLYQDMIQRQLKFASQSGKAGESAVDASRRFSYGILNISHAIQDAQYGFGAVLNNIPLVVTALGGGPGLAGVIMVLGVIIAQTMPHLKAFGIQLGLLQDPANAAGNTIKELQERLKALQDKPYKVTVDYLAIENAERAITLMEKRLAAIKAAAGEPDVQKRAAKAVGTVLTEFGGATDTVEGAENVKNLVKAALLQDPVRNQLATDKDQTKLEELRARRGRNIAGIAGAANEVVRGEMQGRLESVDRQIAAIEAEMNKRLDARVDQIVGAAARGEGGGIAALAGLAEKNQQIFAKGGVFGGVGGRAIRAQPVSPIFAGALREAAPAEIRRVEEEEAEERRAEERRQDRDFRRGLARDVAGKQEAAILRAQGERQAEVGAHAGKFQGDKALGGALGEDLQKLIAGGETDPGKLKNAVFAKAVSRIEASKMVPGDLVADVAVKVIDTVMEKLLAELVGQGENVAGVAKANIAGAAAKAAAKVVKQEEAAGRKEEAAGRKEAKGQKAGQKAGFAAQLQQEFQGGISEEQAGVGAQHYQQLLAHGENANAALREVLAQMTGFFRQNLIAQGEMNGTLGEMQGMIAAAQQQQQQLMAEAQMMRGQAHMMNGRVGRGRVQRAFPMPVIPFGG